MAYSKQVLITIPFDDEVIQKIQAIGYEIIQEKENSNFDGDYKGVEVLVGFKPFLSLKRELLPNLKFIQLVSMGFEQVTKEFQTIPVANNRGAYSPQIGEFIVARLLSIYKQFRLLDNYQTNAKWERKIPIEELTGKTIVFLGTGSLAQEASKRLQHYGLHIIGINRSGNKHPLFDKVHSFHEVNHALPKADAVICTLPHTTQTDHFCDSIFFSHMKSDSIFMNVSRGKVVDETALFNKASDLRAIVLDVFDEEPLHQNHRFWSLPNAYLSSHVSWVSQWNEKRRANIVLENLKRFKEGREILHLVDFSRGY